MSFEPVVKLSELPDVGAVLVRVDGRPISIVRTEDGEIHAIDDVCTHANVSLSEGEVEDDTIECWLHGSRFDLISGEPTGLPATVPIGVYPVHVEGDDVLIDVTAPLSTVKEH